MIEIQNEKANICLKYIHGIRFHITLASTSTCKKMMFPDDNHVQTSNTKFYFTLVTIVQSKQ